MNEKKVHINDQVSKPKKRKRLRMMMVMASLTFFAVFAFYSLCNATVFTSVTTGDWNNGATWGNTSPGTQGIDWPGNTDDAIISTGHTVTLKAGGAGTTIDNFTINAGSTLDHGGKKMIVTGNYTNNGTQTKVGGPGPSLKLSGVGTTIDGAGTITFNNDIEIISGNKTVLISANLTISADVYIVDAITVTNKGTFKVNGVLDGQNASATWVNDTNSTVSVGGTGTNDGVFMGQGVLTASAPGNTVEYDWAVDPFNQNIKDPTASTYHHLILSGSGTKFFQANITVNGNITISSTLHANGFNINLKGNWSNTGTYTNDGRLVTFDGTGAQSITNTSGDVFFDLTTNKSAGTLTLIDHVTVSNTFTMTLGNIDAGTKILTLGTDAGNVGTFSYTAGWIIGKFERWIASTTIPAPPVLFPVGISDTSRQANITLNTLTSAGTLIEEFVTSSPGSNGLPLADSPGTDTVRNTFTEGYWNLSGGNGLICTDYSQELTGLKFTSYTINPSTRLLTRSNSGSNWTINGTHVAAVAPVAKRNNITALPAQHCFGDTTDCTSPTTSPIIGTNSVCKGVTGVSYSVTNNSPNTYAWSIIPSSAGTFNPASPTGNSAAIDWGSTGQTATVRVVETNTCGPGSPVDYSVNIHTLPTSSISGKTGVGENSTGEPYSVTNTAGYTYDWIITGGTLNPSPDTDNSVTVDWGVAGTGKVQVVADSGGCSAADTVSLNVTIYAVITSIADGNWNQTATWDCSCDPTLTPTASVVISSGDTVTLVAGGAGTTINNFTINTNGTLDHGGKKFTVTGDYTNNGTQTMVAGPGPSLKLSGAGTTIDGNGTINLNNGIEILGAKTILA
ncbi:hypothetical protein JYT51_02050, partial [Candidatus Amoebophilus asiaticus]|nr:hypothetical protein [Candidatus Amoebophilus asiaticus]